MCKKSFLILIIVFLFGNFLSAQQAKIDSAIISLDNCETDTCRIMRMLDIAELYETSDADLMFSYYQQADRLLEENASFSKGRRKALGIISNYRYVNGEFKESLRLFKQIEEFEINAMDTMGWVNSLNNQSMIFEILGEYENALKINFNALDLCNSIGYQTGVSDSYTNIGIIHYRNSDFDKSVEYFEKALTIREKNGTPKELASANNNVGLAYFALEDVNHAKIHMTEAIRILSEAGLEQQLASAYINYGGLLTDQGDGDEAILYYEKALEVMKKTNNQIGIVNAKISVGEHYLLTKSDIDEGIRVTEEGVELAKEINYFAGIKFGYDCLSKLKKEEGDYKKSMEYYELYVNINDSLESVNYKTNLAEIETKYENSKKIQENLNLENSNAKIAKDFQNLVIWGTVIVLLLVGLIIGIGLYFRQRELKIRLLNIELEQKALKAQMNPHFIFNALNSIQSCIVSGDTMTAYRYHAKFAKLMRLILRNSEEKSITLKQELDSLRLYIELEQFRTEDKFDFVINVEDQKLEEQMTPSLLFQPFVENAIWHGLMNKKDGKGFLSISLIQIENQIQCTITDNGVGRKQAAINNSKMRDPDHKSIGIGVTKSRIEIFNRENGSNVEVTFKDNFEQNIAAGTTVEFYLPMLI